MQTPLNGEILSATDPAQPRLAEELDAIELGFWPKLKQVLARLPFAEDLVAAYYCATDPATPLKARAALMGALIYFLSPFDAIPDVIAGLGYTDDASVLMGVLALVSVYLKPAHRTRAKAKINELSGL